MEYSEASCSPLPGRIALPRKPDDVGLGEVDEEPACVLAEGHARVGEPLEKGGVEELLRFGHRARDYAFREELSIQPGR